MVSGWNAWSALALAALLPPLAEWLGYALLALPLDANS